MQTETIPQPSANIHGKSRKRWMFTLGAVLVIGIAAVIFFAWRANNDGTPQTEEITVSLTAAGVVPETIRIAPGQSITWVNGDSQPHRLEADQTDELDEFNVELNPGDSFDFTFEESGTFTYHDPLHAELFKGVIIVE